MATEYDAEVIQEQADLLYAQADRALITNTIVLGVLGVLVGGASFNFVAVVMVEMMSRPPTVAAS